MIHKGRVLTSNKQKADLFARHYAAVSRLTFTDEERAENLYLKKILKSTSVDDSSCSAFTMSELKSAICKMKRKGAAFSLQITLQRPTVVVASAAASASPTADPFELVCSGAAYTGARMASWGLTLPTSCATSAFCVCI